MNQANLLDKIGTAHSTFALKLYKVYRKAEKIANKMGVAKLKYGPNMDMKAEKVM